MKKLVKFLKVVLPVASILIFVGACQKNTAPKVKSATVIFKAAAKKINNKSTASLSGLSFSVKGGTLTLSAANVSFGIYTFRKTPVMTDKVNIPEDPWQ